MSEPPSRPALGPTLSHPTTGLAPPQVVVIEHSDNQTETKTNKHKDKETQKQTDTKTKHNNSSHTVTLSLVASRKPMQTPKHKLILDSTLKQDTRTAPKSCFEQRCNDSLPKSIYWSFRMRAHAPPRPLAVTCLLPGIHRTFGKVVIRDVFDMSSNNGSDDSI